MSFGIKYLCAVTIKSPPNHRKTSTNVYRDASGSLVLSSAELMALNLDGNAVFVTAKDMAPAFQPQAARTIQQKGPVYGEFHRCAGNQDLR